jgi:hypothetical protein
MTFYCVFIYTELLAITTLIRQFQLPFPLNVLKVIKIWMLPKCEIVALAVCSVKKN